MPRTRYLKPTFFVNEQLASMSPLARLFFQGLWCWADREGRLEDRPDRLKAEILPYDRCDPEELLRSLQKRGFIIRYRAEARRFIQIVNFVKHQRPHMKEIASRIPPAPNGAVPSTDPAPIRHRSDTQPIRLDP